MIDEKKQNPSEWEVHRLAGAMQNIHRQYGLWILHGSAGCVAPVNGYEHCQLRYFEFYSLSHLHQGHGRLWLEGEEYDINSGDAVLITPRSLNRYGGNNNMPYVEDAVCFCGPIADMLKNAGIIRNGICHLGPVRRLVPIIELATDPATDAQINANIALQQLLVELYNEGRRQEGGANRMELLLSTVKQRLEHWWTIKELCELSSLSDDQLRRLFLAHTGMLPKSYIEQLKMRKAAELLLSGRDSIQEIAHYLGYRDQFHFSRRFKNFTGTPPSNYRKEWNNGHPVLHSASADGIVKTE